MTGAHTAAGGGGGGGGPMGDGLMGDIGGDISTPEMKRKKPGP